MPETPTPLKLDVPPGYVKSGLSVTGVAWLAQYGLGELKENDGSGRSFTVTFCVMELKHPFPSV